VSRPRHVDSSLEVEDNNPLTQCFACKVAED
jgi:hypothetical protein